MSTLSNPFNIRDLLGSHLSTENLTEYITSLSSIVSTGGTTVPEVKSYPDAVYLNYFALGLSLLFSPQNGYKPTTGLKLADLNKDNLFLDSIDIYNIPKRKSSDSRSKSSSVRSAELAFSTHPVSPLRLKLTAEIKDKDDKILPRPSQIDIHPHTIGKDFVECFGEPDRKGGGAGPSSGSIGIWCEWSKDGVMVEFGGDEARGPQAWERGKDAVWKVITVFSSKEVDWM